MSATFRAKKNIPIPPAQAIFPSSKLQLLSGFGKEQKRAQEKKADVKDDKTALRLCELLENSFARFYSASNYFKRAGIAVDYEKMCAELKEEGYSAQDVKNFSIVLAAYQEWAGFAEVAPPFLSALINSGKDTEYTITTSNLSPPLGLIGYELENRKLTVEGDVGGAVGAYMKNSELIVKGNAGPDVGHGMASGKLTVEGDAGMYRFNAPEGGSVCINGELPFPADLNPYFFSSHWVKEPVISGIPNTFKNRMREISRTIKMRFSSTAKIYHKEKLVCDRGVHGIPLYIMHPILALQGKLERW